MADYIFDGSAGEAPDQQAFDGGWHTLGVEAPVSAPATAVGGRAFWPSTDPANFLWVVFRDSDSQIMMQVDLVAAVPSPVNNAWNAFTDAVFTIPPGGSADLDPAETYAVVVATDGDFTFRNSGVSYPYSTGSLISGTASRFFNGGSGAVFPTGTNTTDLFGADILVQAAATGVNGILNAVLPALQASFTAEGRASGVLTIALPALQASFTAETKASGILNAVLPPLQASFTAVTGRVGVLNAVLPALQASFTGTAEQPPPPGGFGSLTITVDAWAQLEAAAQRILCWAGQPSMLVVDHRTGGLPRLVLPERGFGTGPLRAKTAGPDILAGYVTGEHRIVDLGNAEATEVMPDTCGPLNSPRPNTVTTRIGGNPAAIVLDYDGFTGPVNILWGDGSVDAGLPASASTGHTYPGEGVYTVTIQDADTLNDAAVFAVAVP